jgi:hypothetical protein
VHLQKQKLIGLRNKASMEGDRRGQSQSFLSQSFPSSLFACYAPVYPYTIAVSSSLAWL